MASDRSERFGRITKMGRTVRGSRPCHLGILLLATTLGGCRDESVTTATTIGETYEVKGRVLLSDGRPLASGRVTFVSADGLSQSASGEVGADGSFALSTKSPGDGALPGPYKVRIEPAKGAGSSRPGFPLKYIDEESSGLVVTVLAEPNQLEPITLK